MEHKYTVDLPDNLWEVITNKSKPEVSKMLIKGLAFYIWTMKRFKENEHAREVWDEFHGNYEKIMKEF